MPPRLQNKVALVTGCAQGIGAAIAELFVEHGAQVALNVHHDNAQSQMLHKRLGEARSGLFVADVSDAAKVRAMAEAALSRFGRIDILVNNAGINVFHDPLKLTAAEWERCFSVDLLGAWHCAQAVLPAMLRQSAGSIINIASVHGHKIIPNCFPYPVAKHALIGLTRALALQYAAAGVRVNSISPGLIMTPIAEAMFAQAADPAAERRRQAELLPCKRIGEPLEVAYTALFLASDEARFINAADILIDGGRSQLYHE